jgi:putative nucleotidyltransferase with HDIG domain
MVTAIHDISVAIDTMRRGAYDYLLKPFEREHLVSTVQRALDHRQALQETHNYQQSLEQVVRARTEMLRQAMDDLEHSYDVTLEALGDALDLKDSETEGHSKRVTAYTIALARAIGISPAQIKVIARGAFLHDIGKMAIPDDILRKPGSLSPEEQEVMRDHCTRGYHMLRKIPFLAEAAEIVYSHQEHYDGGGYPNRTRGNEIPIALTARRVASTRRASRFCAAPEPSSIPPWSRSSSRFPMSCGTNSARRLPGRTSASRPSISRRPRFPLPPRFLIPETDRALFSLLK